MAIECEKPIYNLNNLIKGALKKCLTHGHLEAAKELFGMRYAHVFNGYLMIPILQKV